MTLQGATVICADLLDPDDSRWPDSAAAHVRCDVSAKSDVAVLAEHASRYGGAQILVNCAGIGSTTDTIGTDSETREHVFAVIARGPSLPAERCCRT